MFFKFLRVLPFVFLIACEVPPAENRELSSKLAGEWRTKGVIIKMNSYKNTPETKNFFVSEHDWEKQMGIRLIHTTYDKNGTYHSEHFNLSDSLLLKQAGVWKIYGDSLIMTDTFPARGQTYRYRIEVSKKLAKLWSLEDSDGDGFADDDYYGELLRYQSH
jgi:hypothetical protein